MLPLPATLCTMLGCEMWFLSKHAAYEADECLVHDYLMMRESESLFGFCTVHSYILKHWHVYHFVSLKKIFNFLFILFLPPIFTNADSLLSCIILMDKGLLSRIAPSSQFLFLNCFLILCLFPSFPPSAVLSFFLFLKCSSRLMATALIPHISNSFPPVHGLSSGLLCLSTCICLSVSTFGSLVLLFIPGPLLSSRDFSSGYIIYIIERWREKWWK